MILLFIKTLKTYCASFKQNTVNKISSFKRAKQNRLVLVSNCAVCMKKKSNFIKNQEASRLLSDLRLRIPINKIPVLGKIFF